MFLFVNVLLMIFISSSYTFDPELTDSDLYGPMLAANQYLVVSILNRTAPSFAAYRPYNSSEFCEIDVTIGSLNPMYAMQLTVPQGASATPDVFFFQGVPIGTNASGDITIVKVTITSMPNCSSSSNFTDLSNISAKDYSAFSVKTADDVVYYLDHKITYMYNFQNVSSASTPMEPTGIDSTFVYYTMYITDGGWGVIGGAIAQNGINVPTLYLATFPSSVDVGSPNSTIQTSWTAPFEYSWQTAKARSVSGPTDYDPMYGMSLAINYNGDILFGVQSMNTVFRLYVNSTNLTSLKYISSRIPSTSIASIGFGKNVGWLNDTVAVILANNVSLDYTQWTSSSIEIYDLNNGKQLNNTQGAYSSFPSTSQPMYTALTGQIVLMVASCNGSVIFMDSDGNVYSILKSPIGYYTATDVGNSRLSTIYFSSALLCSPGTDKADYTGAKHLFDSCKLCSQGTFNPGSNISNNTCLPCDTTQYFCPIGSVAEVPLASLKAISQATTFPKSPDITEFSDILLMNMFNTNFEGNCLVTTPFFWTLLMFGIACILLITMGILQLTGKCENYRTKIELVFRHLDIINEGERWMGGVLSISILVIIIFAALFTNSFVQQYPQATSRAPEFTCDETLRNSKFSSHMQPFGAAVPNDAKEIFNLLASQRFTLTVTLLNTVVDMNVTIIQTIGTITDKLSPSLSVLTDGCLTISCNLTAQVVTITMTLFTAQAIGGLRIGLSGSAITGVNNEVKELNFSTSFSITNRTLSQDPYFNIELIQVINETQPLSSADASNFSGLWIPTLSKDDDRNFQTQADYEIYHTSYSTILTIDLTQAVFYIYNKEKPIIKTAAVVFTNTLFATMCLEIFAFVFLFFKLAVVPFIRLIIQLVRPKKEKEGKEHTNEEGESDEEEEGKETEHESDGDEIEEIRRPVKFEPGKNEYYSSDNKV